MENNKIKLSTPVIKNSLKSLKEINKKDNRKKKKKNTLIHTMMKLS